MNDLPLDERRPELWVPPLVEWVVLSSTLGWVAVVGVLLIRLRMVRSRRTQDVQ